MNSSAVSEAAAPFTAAGGCPSRVIRLVVNGVPQRLEVENWVSLLDLLRDRLDLTGTKKGCDHGQCGACTVIVDGRRVISCLTLAAMHDGATVITVEGLPILESDGGMHPLQRAFIANDAFQCGYCTPGQLCSAAALVMSERPPSNTVELRERLSGNLCRCGAYPQIVKAVCDVLAQKGRKDEAPR